MVKTIKINDDTHRLITLRKAHLGFKTYDEYIKYSAELEARQPPITEGGY